MHHRSQVETRYRHIQNVYSMLVQKGVPNVDRLVMSHEDHPKHGSTIFLQPTDEERQPRLASADHRSRDSSTSCDPAVRFGALTKSARLYTLNRPFIIEISAGRTSCGEIRRFFRSRLVYALLMLQETIVKFTPDDLPLAVSAAGSKFNEGLAVPQEETRSVSG
jgi:hypothetical protein